MKNRFFQGHGLGNEYIVLDPAELAFTLTPGRIAMLCDRVRGIGSDGVLTLEDSDSVEADFDSPEDSGSADFGMRIWNPDGGEAEISGNGLRIFARWLHATGRTRERTFTVETPGGTIQIETLVDPARAVYAATVHMGRATFNPKALPCTLEVDELVEQPISAAGEALTFTGVSVGNPHCVIFSPSDRPWHRDDLLRLGPALATHPVFPHGINLQLTRATGPHSLYILIWERGAGETPSSGSSACAVASAGVRLGLVTTPVTVESPGGELVVDVGDGFDLTMTGPVEEVDQGTLNPALVEVLSDVGD